MSIAESPTTHQEVEQYSYPFPPSGETEHFKQAGIDPSISEGTEIYVASGFDLQQEVSSLPGPIVEIGGPSDLELAVLRDIKLPSKPIITNIVGSNREAKGAASLTEDDRLALDMLADVRQLPFADESLGMVLVSCIDITDEASSARIDEFMQDLTPANQDQKWSQMAEEAQKPYQEARALLDAGRGNELAQSSSPRIATIGQAARVLKPTGLFIMGGAGQEDVDIAQGLGLELAMHVPERILTLSDGQKHIVDGTVVLRKPENSHNPAAAHELGEAALANA